MQRDVGTPVQQRGLKDLAARVLGRNTAARQSCDTPPDGVLHTIATKNSPAQHCCDTAELPPVLTISAIPALAERLRLQGWKVNRKGNELICTAPRKVRPQ